MATGRTGCASGTGFLSGARTESSEQKLCSIFRDCLRQSRPNNIKGELDVCPSVRAYGHAYAHKFFDSLEIGHVGRGRPVMHDGMPYDPIQGQGHETLKVGNLTIFKMYLLPHFQRELANDCRLLN